jgi:hypothetical protein
LVIRFRADADSTNLSGRDAAAIFLKFSAVCCARMARIFAFFPYPYTSPAVRRSRRSGADAANTVFRCPFHFLFPGCDSSWSKPLAPPQIQNTTTIIR